MKPWNRHAQRYRARGTRPYSSLQRALAAGIAPQALFQRRDEPPDGWQLYLIPADPARLRGAVSGEIATPPCEARSITGIAIAIATPGNALREPRDREECAAAAPPPRTLIGAAVDAIVRAHDDS